MTLIISVSDFNLNECAESEKLKFKSGLNGQDVHDETWWVSCWMSIYLKMNGIKDSSFEIGLILRSQQHHYLVLTFDSSVLFGVWS